MQVRCPNCSTAYEIPPPVRPRRLRCARCDTEWRALPPETPDDPAVADPIAPAGPSSQPAPATPSEPLDAPVAEPMPGPAAAATGDAALAHAVRPPLAGPAMPAPGVVAPLAGDAIGRRATPPAGKAEIVVWMALWVLSLLLIAGALFAAWHFRAALEQGWPATARLFRLLPGGATP